MWHSLTMLQLLKIKVLIELPPAGKVTIERASTGLDFLPFFT